MLFSREELHLHTLKAFVDLHEFSDLNLVQALRSVCSCGLQHSGTQPAPTNAAAVDPTTT